MRNDGKLPGLRVRVRVAAIAWAACLALCLTAAGAGAVPVVSFDASEDLEALGIEHPGVSRGTALASGVPRFFVEGDDLFTLFDPDGIAPDSLLFDIPLPDFVVDDRSSPASVSQPWGVSNNTGRDLASNLALVFLEPFRSSIDVDGTTREYAYDRFDVALDLGNGFEWIIVQLSDNDTGEELYYPALRLGPLAADDPAVDVEIDMILQNPVIFERLNSEFVLGPPDWELRAAFVQPIPEPSTALLVALGCAALALRPSRRS